MRTIFARYNYLVAAALVANSAGCSGSGNGNSNSGASNVGGGNSSPSGGAATGGRATANSTGGTRASINPATGGAPTGGAATGGTKASSNPATGGAATGGASSTGAATGVSATGGSKSSTGGATTNLAGGRTSTDGSSTNAGGTSTGGTSAGATCAGGDSASGVTPSKGCGKTDGAKTLTTGGSSVSGAPTTSTRLHVTSGGKSRDVIIDIPADYDPTHPYRLVFSWRQMGGSDTGNATGLHPAGDGPNFDAEHYAYFGLRRESLNAKQPVIFVAPDTDPIGGLWDYNKDSVYFDDLLTLVTTDLCIDESRVFTTGFSYGAMMSYGLSNGRASTLRAAVTMAPSQFGPNTGTTPIAYMSTTGMSDGTCTWGNDSSGGKGCVIQHAKENGCTIPATFPMATVGSKKYVCYDFEGCKAGYPVKVCTFDGPHTPSSIDDGTTVGEDGLKAFIPPIAWEFIAQF